MKAFFRRVLPFLSASLLSISWMAHGQRQATESMRESILEQTSWPVAGRVTTAQGDAVRGVTVLVAPLDVEGSRVLTTDAKGEFRTEYILNFKKGHEFRVTLTAKKKGFQTAHAFADYDTSGKSRMLSLILRGLEEDPALLSPADLISALAPKLKQLGPAEGLAEKSKDDYARGVADFLDQHNAAQSVPLLSKVLKSNPTCIGCRTMLGLAELDWGDWGDAQEAFTEGVNATRQDPKMVRPEPLVAYGTWVSWQHEPEKAQPFFQEALKYAPEDALALQELGRTLLLLHNFETANEVLKRALAAGAGPEGRLLHAESLQGVGRTDEAAAEMDRYLDGRDVKKMPLRVREVWASIQNWGKVEASTAKTQSQAGPESRVISREGQGRPVVDRGGRAPASLALLDLQQGYVKDFAGALNTTTVERLSGVSAEVDQKAKAQIALVTIRTLEGDSVEDFANHLFQKWGAGHKGTDRGVMVLLAMQERKFWTKVGDGLEPILPDGKVLEFERGMVPLLRKGDYNSAVEQIVSQITRVIEQDSRVSIASLADIPGVPVDFLRRPPPSLTPGLEPARDQEQLSSILDGVGTRILDLIKNFPNTSSLEAIHQEKVSHLGESGSQNQKFRYLCLPSSEAGGPGFTEYRTDFTGNEARPRGLSEGYMLTEGFTSTALIFHPQYRSESTFRYLGRQKVNGRNTYVVAYAQIPGKAHFTTDFRQGATSRTLFSQGVAWIDAATYQIIRLHTDLLAPLPEVLLEKETVNIDFNEVPFKSLKEPLWLPGNVTVAIDWNGKQLRNQHAYSDFEIFQVGTSQKVGKLNNSRESSKETPEPTDSQ
jgi:tetratricopeptide (TPR) repeat protein